MPYTSNSHLPGNLRGILPPHAQDIFRMAFNNAWQEYADAARRRGRGSREEIAHRVAWAAVKRRFEKRDGGWAAKG